MPHTVLLRLPHAMASRRCLCLRIVAQLHVVGTGLRAPGADLGTLNIVDPTSAPELAAASFVASERGVPDEIDLELELVSAELAAWDRTHRRWLAGVLPGACALLGVLDPVSREEFESGVQRARIALQALEGEVLEADDVTVLRELASLLEAAAAAGAGEVSSPAAASGVKTCLLAAGAALSLDDTQTAAAWLERLVVEPGELDDASREHLGLVQAQLGMVLSRPGPAPEDLEARRTHAGEICLQLARAGSSELPVRLGAHQRLDARLSLMLEQGSAAGLAATEPVMLRCFRERITLLQSFLRAASAELEGRGGEAGAALLATASSHLALLLSADPAGGRSATGGVALEVRQSLEVVAQHDPGAAASAAARLLLASTAPNFLLVALTCELYWRAGMETSALELAAAQGLLAPGVVEEVLGDEETLVALCAALGAILVSRTARDGLSAELLAAHGQLDELLMRAAPRGRVLREAVGVCAAMSVAARDDIQAPYARTTLLAALRLLHRGGPGPDVVDAVVSAGAAAGPRDASQVVSTIAEAAYTCWLAGFDDAAREALTLALEGVAPGITEHLTEPERWRRAAQDTSVRAVLEVQLVRSALAEHPLPDAEVLAVLQGVLHVPAPGWVRGDGGSGGALELALELVGTLSDPLVSVPPRLGQQLCTLVQRSLPAGSARRLSPRAAAGLCTCVHLACRDRHLQAGAGAAASACDLTPLLPGRLTGSVHHLGVREGAWRGVLESVILGPYVEHVGTSHSGAAAHVVLTHLALGGLLGLLAEMWGASQVRAELLGDLTIRLREVLDAPGADVTDSVRAAAQRVLGALERPAPALRAPDSSDAAI